MTTTAITRTILAYINDLLLKASALHVAALQKQTDKQRAKVAKAYKRVESLADIVADLYEQVELDEAKVAEQARANEAEALRILERT